MPRSLRATWSRIAGVLALTCAAAVLPALVPTIAGSATAADCSDVEVVFARGTGETPGLGIVGRPLVQRITSSLGSASVGSHAVDYAAAANQASAGPGATSMTRYVVSRAQECPSTRFVLGGYSQGASVTDIAIGIRTTLGTGETIPAGLASRVLAVAVFGNPLGLSGRTIADASDTYGPKAVEACNRGDSVCGGTGAGGTGYGHLSYPNDGAVDRAASFVADRYSAARS